MSNRNNINRNKKTANMGENIRRSCKHCKNLGKTEQEYTSHWTRASMKPDAPITCPEILKIECAYCHGIGHMASEIHCPLLKSLKKEEKKREFEEARRATLPERAVRSTAAAQKRLSSFSLIAEECSSDSEEETSNRSNRPNHNKTPLDEFPILSSVKCVLSTSNNKTYAMAVKVEQRSADVPVPVAADNFTVFGIAPKKSCPSTGSKNQRKLARVRLVNGVEQRYRNWADDSSDSEED